VAAPVVIGSRTEIDEGNHLCISRRSLCVGLQHRNTGDTGVFAKSFNTGFRVAS
jgi:hypothetical protein